MIISASRRTDIPAFYSKWFMTRLREGFVYVRNPMNRKQVSCITLSPEKIECIVFWTKNPSTLMPYLDEITSLGFHYYFQFTLTGYDHQLEKNLPGKQALLKIFQELSSLIGKEKVIWRYDPIVITDEFTSSYHIKSVSSVAKELKGCTTKCIISFIDMYAKCKKSMKHLSVQEISHEQQFELAKDIQEIAQGYGLEVETCAEAIELDQIGIAHGKCIDDKLISKIIGQDISNKKDPTQRTECGCIPSVDIGTYDTCQHNCVYCYANSDFETVIRNVKEHEVNSPLLIGMLDGSEQITERKIASLIEN